MTRDVIVRDVRYNVMAKLLRPDDPKLACARKIVMAFPGVEERMSHGYPNWRTKNGQFGAYNDHRGYAVLFFQLDARVAEEMIASDDRFWNGGKGRAGLRWLGLDLKGRIPWALARDLLTRSYDHVAP
jgi:hypothetical protein